MCNPKTLGFTLIEIIIVIALLSVIMSLGFLVTLSTYQSYLLRSEQSVLVSVLGRVRNQSLSNINQRPHGACYDSGNHTYVMFEGNSYVSGLVSNISIQGNVNVVISSNPNTFLCTIGSGIVFTQLSGTSSPIDVVVTQNNKVSTTTINYEGTIIW